ncbi:CCT motif-containing protein [Phytophthora infestans]|uniref:CCT motif-containing protein n=1 Tax=Phytophthora infestans TaxID=4787 RepID=A0A833SLJ7_PHYIN|nr:CCT motif-containing protein [Phytophthora infestans]
MATARRSEASFGDVLDGVAVDVVDYRQEKWCRVFMPALRTFHSLFGHTEVPEEFVVPRASPPWPEAAWGLHLGQAISRSQDTKRLYSSQVAKSLQEFQNLGFTWKVTNAADRSWKHQVLPALREFHQQRGHTHVMSSFVVPEWEPWPKDSWGLNLGAIVKRVRAGRSFVDQATRDSDMLDRLGFLSDPRDVEWQGRILPALVTFADEYRNDEPMAFDFVVPATQPWPKQTWGLELGMFLRDSQRREQYFVQIVRDATVLDGLGFEVCLSVATWERQVVPLLTLFSTIFPNQTAVPVDFMIPHERPWPRKMWGLKLGKIAAQNPDRMAAMMSEWKQRNEAAESFSVVSDNRSMQWKTRIYPALVTFVQVFGDCRLGGQFTVPSEAPWPKQTWGLKLGGRIADYVKNGSYFQQVGQDADRLDALGFSFKLLETPWMQHGAPLVDTFSMAHPRTVVPDYFVVPSKAPWQESTWGIKLGKLVRWNSQLMTDIESKWRVQVLKAVEVYQNEHGDINVGEKLVIPSQSPWPSKTWGMDLSRILQRLRTGEYYDGHVAIARNSVVRLQQMLHQRRDEAWESIFIAFKMFFKRFRHCDVKPHFVIPANLSWPKPVWNLQLGQIVDKMKTTGNFFSHVGRYADQLSKLGFTLTFSNVAWDKKVAPLIATFASLHPQDTIPWDSDWGFTIPAKEPWPEYAWGVNLSVLVQWNWGRVKAIERDWRAQVLLANLVYSYENGNKILRDKFVVPSRSPWPHKTWGRELRHILTCVQVGQHYSGHIAIANFHSNEACAGENEQWRTRIFPALHTFAMVFGHCSVPKNYVVPSESPWPKQTFGLQLGIITAEIESSGLYFADVGLNADRLETFGFRYKLADTPWQEHVAPLLKIYATQYPHEILPEDFVVPPKRPWPEELYGLRLGKLMAWSSCFTWSNKAERWKERRMPQNTTLAGEYGYCRVPTTFKVPSELPWPKQMWSLRIKVYLRQLNRKGDFFLSGGLQQALTSEEDVGFVFKLAIESEIEFGEPEVEKYTAQVEQIGRKMEVSEPQSCLRKRPLPDANGPRREGWVGCYSPEARKKRVQRYLKKRQERVWVREVKYDVRKSFADTRLRVQGRFVAREDEKTIRELLSFT